MSNKEKLAWFTYACILVLLFLMSSTNLIIKEKKVEVYPVSVIIENVNDDYYSNFKKGMERAAEEFHVDVSFITLYRDNDQKQQMEVVQREIRDGARALILSPVNAMDTVMALDAMSPNSPVILLGAPLPSDSVVDSVSPERYEMGRMLAETVVREAPRNVPVYLFTEGLEYGGNTNVYDGVRAVLDETGFHYNLVERGTEDTYRQVIEETVYPGKGRITIIALDVKALDEVARIIDGSSVYQSHVAGLYGAGSTTSLLNELEKGIITGLTAYSQFDEGYLSVKRAVEAIQGSRQSQQTELPAFYINRDNMRDKQFEKMFYPIE